MNNLNQKNQITKFEFLISIEQVIERVSFSRPKIYAHIKAGIFPKPVEVPNPGAKPMRNTLWRSSDIDDWIRGLSISAKLTK